MTDPGTLPDERTDDDRLDVGGVDVREFVWGRPLTSVYIRKWVTFAVFTLSTVAILVRLPSAGSFERAVLAPVLLVSVLFAVLALFIVRGSTTIRRREGLRRLAETLVEQHVLRPDEVDVVRTATDLRHTTDGVTERWSVTVPLDRDGATHTLVVDGDASDLARVRVLPPPGQNAV